MIYKFLKDGKELQHAVIDTFIYVLSDEKFHRASCVWYSSNQIMDWSNGDDLWSSTGFEGADFKKVIYTNDPSKTDVAKINLENILSNQDMIDFAYYCHYSMWDVHPEGWISSEQLLEDFLKQREVIIKLD